MEVLICIIINDLVFAFAIYQLYLLYSCGDKGKMYLHQMYIVHGLSDKYLCYLNILSVLTLRASSTRRSPKNFLAQE